MNKGKLIVIEGLDGSGKATQTAGVLRHLTENRLDVKSVSFPDYDNPSSALVKMYLDGSLGHTPGDVNPYAAASFYAVDRYASYKQFWQRDYAAGKLILADRYATSNAIYQLAKLPQTQWDSFLEWIEDYEYNLLQLPRPDRVIFLDMPPSISQHLMSQRYNGDEGKKDLHESNVAYLQQCRQSALYSAQKLNWHIILCAENNKPRNIDSINNEIMEYLSDI
ncbi:MAG TPA: deoxynucleoside kinase [Clostridiales bacterium]|nr:deoxynucleoside kinase [Clostridiales bacterium]